MQGFKYKKVGGGSVHCLAQQTIFMAPAAAVPRQLGHSIWVRMPPLCSTHSSTGLWWNISFALQRMCLVAGTLSPSAATMCLAYLLEEHARSLLCSSSAARKAQSGEPLPSSLPSWAASCLLQNSFIPATPYTFPNFQLRHVLCVSALAAAMGWVKEKGGKSQVRSMMWLLFLCRRDMVPSQPCVHEKGSFSDHGYFSGEMSMHISAWSSQLAVSCGLAQRLHTGAIVSYKPC